MSGKTKVWKENWGKLRLLVKKGKPNPKIRDKEKRNLKKNYQRLPDPKFKVSIRQR